VEVDYLPNIDETVKKKYGFEVDRHDVVFSGICLKCKKPKNKPHIESMRR
jgi:Fe2+ or Zn2+ uptake regulation protein